MMKSLHNCLSSLLLVLTVSVVQCSQHSNKNNQAMNCNLCTCILVSHTFSRALEQFTDNCIMSIQYIPSLTVEVRPQQTRNLDHDNSMSDT